MPSWLFMQCGPMNLGRWTLQLGSGQMGECARPHMVCDD
jgi:hypothetical protein